MIQTFVHIDAFLPAAKGLKMNPDNLGILGTGSGAVMVAVRSKNEDFTLMQFPKLAVFTDGEDSFEYNDQIEHSDTVAVDVIIPRSIGGMSAIHEVRNGR
ncbi:hypothetical protein D3C81_2058020 [compost metagenome]